MAVCPVFLFKNKITFPLSVWKCDKTLMEKLNFPHCTILSNIPPTQHPYKFWGGKHHIPVLIRKTKWVRQYYYNDNFTISNSKGRHFNNITRQMVNYWRRSLMRQVTCTANCISLFKVRFFSQFVVSSVVMNLLNCSFIVFHSIQHYPFLFLL